MPRAKTMIDLVMPTSPIWMMEETAFQRFLVGLAARAKAYLADGEEDDDDDLGEAVQMQGAVAVIACHGVISSDDAWWADVSSPRLVRQIQLATAAPSCAAILLDVNSPGGDAAGMAEVVDALAAARAEKPVWCQVSGMAASGGYMIASQAQKCFAGRMDQIGSIGVRAAVIDVSEMLAKEGIKVEIFDTGPYKSAGLGYAPLTDEHRKYFQGIVDTIFGEFVKCVAKGRRISQAKVRESADGRVWFAEEAMTRGLIDGIQGYAETLSQLTDLASRPKRSAAAKADNPEVQPTAKEDLPVPEVTTTVPAAAAAPAPVAQTDAPAAAKPAATIGQLKTEFPQSTADWRERCLEEGLTIEQATKRYALDLQERLAQSEAALKASQAGKVKPLGGAKETKPADGGVEASQWPVLYKAKLGQVNPQTRQLFTPAEAACAIDEEHPGLRESYIEAYGQIHKIVDAH